ncbi:hypothetical protein DU506_00750 [Vreelandella rituensis]|uniref:Uncharacterized protein n=1 Tax=Vreelandella rituensis TaxID=2282306 RepID=A0A368U9S9_9GAMM|nr:hypothetical protein DU506_00750 [Halomonas rituensis]
MKHIECVRVDYGNSRGLNHGLAFMHDLARMDQGWLVLGTLAVSTIEPADDGMTWGRGLKPLGDQRFPDLAGHLLSD